MTEISPEAFDVMQCRYINGLDSMDCRFLLVVTSPWESAIFVVITVNRPLSYLGKFFHRLYILPCRYKYTIREYWSSWHWCHIQEKKHHIRQCLEQQTYWLISRLSLIVRVNVVLNRTVVVDSDWRFDNLCGSHLQSQSELYHVSWWYYTLVIDLTSQLRRDVIGHQRGLKSKSEDNNSGSTTAAKILA